MIRTNNSKTFLVVCSLFFCQVYCQQQWTGSSDLNGSLYRLGNVGIGSNNPAAKLDVTGESIIRGAMYLCAQSPYHYGYLSWGTVANGQGVLLGAAQNKCLSFGVNGGIDNMVITSSGNVGIGTKTPKEKLEIWSPDNLAVEWALSLRNPHNENSSMPYGVGIKMRNSQYEETKWSAIAAISENGFSNDTGLGFFTDGVSTEKMRISANGNVGIGTTTPGKLLDINGESVIRGNMELSGVNGYGVISWGQVAGGRGVLLRANSGKGLSFGVNGASDNVIVNASGNVGIGTVTPAEKLQVNGKILADQVIELYGADDVAQGGVVTVTGGSLEFGGPTARNGKGCWKITSHPQTLTLNMPGAWWTFAVSFTGSHWISEPGRKTPKSYRLEKSINGDDWTVIADDTNNTKNSVYWATWDAPYIRLTVRAPQKGETVSNVGLLQVFQSHFLSSGKGPFTLSGMGDAVFIDGNVGIGLPGPNEKMCLKGNNNTPTFMKIQSYSGSGSDTDTGIKFSLSDGSDVVKTAIVADSKSYYRHDLRFVLNNESNQNSYNSDADTRMLITSSGNIGIGTTTPDYKLDVVGKIRAHEIIVNTVKQADYVFEKEYDLMPLEKVEEYIQQDKHLPGIPSAKEVEQNGVSMGEMQVKHLQKIEELTLYVIEQNKLIKQLQNRISVLECDR